MSVKKHQCMLKWNGNYSISNFLLHNIICKSTASLLETIVNGCAIHRGSRLHLKSSIMTYTRLSLLVMLSFSFYLLLDIPIPVVGRYSSQWRPPHIPQNPLLSPTLMSQATDYVQLGYNVNTVFAIGDSTAYWNSELLPTIICPILSVVLMSFWITRIANCLEEIPMGGCGGVRTWIALMPNSLATQVAISTRW